MRMRAALAAAILVLSTLGGVAPAQARDVTVVIGVSTHDGYGWRSPRWQARRSGTLSPREIRQVLRARGYRQIQYLDRKGRIYEVHATDPRGQRVGLIVGARDGAILNAYRF